MRLARPQIWIASLSASAVLLLAVVDMGRTSPGPLAAVHERQPELAGRRDCSECHGGWRQTMAEACLDCHEVIERQVRHAEGLHGMLGKERALLCARCHSEHHGSGFAIVNRQSFVRAGITDPDRFDHALVGFVMDGRHLELDCRRCHPNCADAVLPEGTTRFIGLEKGCASCHEDSHEGRMELACASCHGQQDWKELHSLGHEEHLPLIGGHAAVDCRSCHDEQGLHSLERLGGRDRPSTPRACLDCHESPHAEPFERGSARLAGLAAEAACVACHTAEHDSFRDERLELSDEWHAASGFSLELPHEQADCADCHDPLAESFELRYPGRGPDDCAQCHEDVHAGQFSEGPFASGGCIGCHDRERFEPHAFTASEHEAAALVLTGRHLELECAQCHEVPREGEPRRFRGTPSECAGCHEDAHEDYFADHAEVLESAEHGACAACHLTTSFSELPSEGFDHARWTGFAVDGAHAQSACESCHERAHEPDAGGRTFGRVTEHFGAYEGCVSCHEDPHAGAFDPPAHPALVDGRADCARCHDTVSFRSFPEGFDHRRWTGFALQGRHAEVGCSACHAPLERAPTARRAWGAAKGSACADCHADPHAGQFASREGTDCARCHVSSSSFELLGFDHARDSRFELGEAHAALACAACHLTETTEGGAELVRYRPLPTGCADCHGIHDQPLLRRRRGGG